MAILDVYRDSRRKGACRSCGAPIEWAELVTSGKMMPFEGEIVVQSSQGSLLTDERTIDTIDTTVSPSHFGLCPHADEWRKPR